MNSSMDSVSLKLPVQRGIKKERNSRKYFFGRKKDESISLNRSLKRWSAVSDNASLFSALCIEKAAVSMSLRPADTNKYLGEVISYLAEGYEDKLPCDSIVLKINAARYAYNIQLHEVDMFVVRALLTLTIFEQIGDILGAMKEITKFFRPIFKNYIKSKSSAIDCLIAVEEICIQCEWLKGNCFHFLRMLYYENIIHGKYIVEFYELLKESNSQLLKYHSITKYVQWLQQEISNQ